MTAFTIDLSAILSARGSATLTSNQFDQLCQANPEIKFERTPAGELVIMSPADKQVEIYQLGRSIEILQAPATLTGEPVLPGFSLNLRRLWNC